MNDNRFNFTTPEWTPKPQDDGMQITNADIAESMIEMQKELSQDGVIQMGPAHLQPVPTGLTIKGVNLGNGKITNSFIIGDPNGVMASDKPKLPSEDPSLNSAPTIDLNGVDWDIEVTDSIEEE